MLTASLLTIETSPFLPIWIGPAPPAVRPGPRARRVRGVGGADEAAEVDDAAAPDGGGVPRAGGGADAREQRRVLRVLRMGDPEAQYRWGWTPAEADHGSFPMRLNRCFILRHRWEHYAPLDLLCNSEVLEDASNWRNI